MTPAAFRKLALSMPGAHEEPHFDRTSFRIGKNIFATMTSDGGEAMVPVKPLELCMDLLTSKPAMFFSYGGFTTRFGSLGVRLAKVDDKLLRDLMHEAWSRIATKKPSARRPKKTSG